MQHPTAPEDGRPVKRPVEFLPGIQSQLRTAHDTD